MAHNTSLIKSWETSVKLITNEYHYIYIYVYIYIYMAKQIK